MYEETQRLIERRALETCLASWSGLSCLEVLEILESGDESRMSALVVGDSQTEMTRQELASRIRSEYRFFSSARGRQ